MRTLSWLPLCSESEFEYSDELVRSLERDPSVSKSQTLTASTTERGGLPRRRTPADWGPRSALATARSRRRGHPPRHAVLIRETPARHALPPDSALRHSPRLDARTAAGRAWGPPPAAGNRSCSSAPPRSATPSRGDLPSPPSRSAVAGPFIAPFRSSCPTRRAMEQNHGVSPDFSGSARSTPPHPRHAPRARNGRHGPPRPGTPAVGPARAAPDGPRSHRLSRRPQPDLENGRHGPRAG